MPSPFNSLSSHVQNMSSCFFLSALVGVVTATQNLLLLHHCLANSTSLKSQLKNTASMKLPIWEESDQSETYRKIVLGLTFTWELFSQLNRALKPRHLELRKIWNQVQAKSWPFTSLLSTHSFPLHKASALQMLKLPKCRNLFIQNEGIGECF